MALPLEQNARQPNWRRQVAANVESVLASIAVLEAAVAALPTFLTGSKTYDPPSLAFAVQAQTTVTVTGAALGQFAVASFSLDTQGITISAVVSATNTVTVTMRNDNGGTVDLASGTLAATVFA